MQTMLFDPGERVQPRKDVRPVSADWYHHVPAPELRADRQMVYDCIGRMRERRGQWPTRGEIAMTLFRQRKIARPDASLIAPRLTELSKGVQDRKTKQFVGGGWIARGEIRPCRVAKARAHEWAIVRQGNPS